MVFFLYPKSKENWEVESGISVQNKAGKTQDPVSKTEKWKIQKVLQVILQFTSNRMHLISLRHLITSSQK